MEFLKGLKEAMSMDISKDEFMTIWTKEMNSKRPYSNLTASEHTISSDTTQTLSTKSSAEESSQGEHPRDDDEKQDIMILVNQMAEYQKEMKQQLQEQQEIFSHLHLQLQEQQQNMQNHHDKLCQIEKTVSTLDQYISTAVQKCLDKEGRVLQDKLMEVVQTNHNHTVEEIQKQRIGLADDISERISDALRKNVEESNCLKDVQKSQVLKQQLNDRKETSNIQATAEKERVYDDDGNGRVDNSFNSNAEHDFGNSQRSAVMKPTPIVFKKEEKAELEEAESRDASCSLLRTATAKSDFRSVLRNELNGLLVELQKLILKPITSESIVLQFVERMKSLQENERNIHSNSLHEVQSAMSEEIRARFLQLQQSIKGHILKAMQDLPQHSSDGTNDDMQAYLEKLIKLEIISVRNDVEKLGGKVTQDLPSMIAENLSFTLLHELKDMLAFDEKTGQKYQADFTEKKSTHKAKPCQTKEALGNEQHFSKDSGFAKMQSEVTTFTTSDPATAWGVEPTTLACSERMEGNKLQGQNTRREPFLSEEMTDAHFELMSGHEHPTHFKCCLTSVAKKFTENAVWKRDVTDGHYHFVLSGKFHGRQETVEFSLTAVRGQLDQQLTWPVDVEITIVLGEQKTSMVNERDASMDSAITKRRFMNRPDKCSRAVPIHFFRRKLVDCLVSNDSLVLLCSVTIDAESTRSEKKTNKNRKKTE